MKRNYESGVSESADFFVGTEVEHTPMHGERTLFIVGVQSADAIVQMATALDVKHIYFGANMSFPNIDTNDADAWAPWEQMIKTCLKAGFWCTLDLDVRQAEGLLESGLTENNRFVPMISVKLPYIAQFNYNTTIKIDDRTWGATNPGVWTHQLHDLMTNKTYTHWDQYTQDTTL